MQSYYIDFTGLRGFSLILFIDNEIVGRLGITEAQYDEYLSKGVPTL